MNNLSEITIYLIAEKNFKLEKETLNNFLQFCNIITNFDFVGSDKALNYDGTQFPQSIFMDFDINKEKLDKLWKKEHFHRNITLYDWQQDSPLREIVDTIQDVSYENNQKHNNVNTISLLIGGHCIFSPDNKTFTDTAFSLAFLLSQQPKDFATLDLELRRDSQFCDHLSILSEYFHTNFSVKIGLS